MNTWQKKLQSQGLHQQNTNWGKWALFIGAFADASFLPFPLLSFFILLILMNDSLINGYIALATLGTLFGAMAGYILGYYASENLNTGFSGSLQYLITHVPGFSEDGFSRIQFLYSKWKFWILFLASFTPIPYGLFSISSGVFKINLFVFGFLTLICQTLKFWLFAVLITKLGTKVKAIFAINLKPYAMIAMVVIALFILSIQAFRMSFNFYALHF